MRYRIYPWIAKSWLFACLLLVLSAPGFSLDSSMLNSPALMTSLEEEGLNLGKLLFNQSRAVQNDKLFDDKSYASIASTLTSDLKKLKGADRYLSVTMAKKHRLFNAQWLQSKDAFYELIGVVPRFDMAPFGSQKFRCGETRLIYRLAYEKKWKGSDVYSRLPLILNVVFWNTKNLEPKDHSPKLCSAIARDWNALRKKDLAAFLLKKMSRKNLKSIEVNMQAVRWPSTVRPDFGGYAEYILRVFTQENKNRFVPSTLLNTLDTAKIKSNLNLKKELKAFLLSERSLAQADNGTLRIPEKFLATKTTSFAFHGSHRKANRHLDLIFNSQELEGPSWSKYNTFKSKQAWKRRVEDHSCAGCHQGRSIAGFHFVGKDKEKSFFANKIFFAQSGHLREDKKRREQFFQELVQGKSPKTFREFSERSPKEKGLYGAHCTLGKDKSFREWTCANGLKCENLVASKPSDDLGIGVCMPKTAGTGGDPSETGTVTQLANPRKDRVTQKKERACSEGYSSFDARDGFPSGICFKECPAHKKQLKEGEACGLIAFNGFNPCLARGEAFTKCLSQFTGELVLKSCGRSAPCRNDYVCAKAKGEKGVCIPPYFLFQLRLDGHPKPS